MALHASEERFQRLSRALVSLCGLWGNAERGVRSTCTLWAMWYNITTLAGVVQSVERLLAKEKVTSSSLVARSFCLHTVTKRRRSLGRFCVIPNDFGVFLLLDL